MPRTLAACPPPWDLHSTYRVAALCRAVLPADPRQAVADVVRLAMFGPSEPRDHVAARAMVCGWYFNRGLIHQAHQSPYRHRD